MKYTTRNLERWFTANQRKLPWRDRYDPYHVWVSEVMLQQTRMEVVLGYYEQFLSRFPTIKLLASSSVDDVLAAWSGLGYYRRARLLHEGAKAAAERGAMPESVDELMSIPGIGRYTAGAIASIAFQQRAAIVDGNVARVIARLEAIESPLGSPELMRKVWLHAEELVGACEDPRKFNQALMELGALVCTPRNPDCTSCPVSRFCAAYSSGRTQELPRPKTKVATRELEIPLYIIRDDRGHVLMRRERGELMQMMFHLPHGDTSLLPGLPPPVRRGSLLGTFRHSVTNRRIEFAVFEAELSDPLADSGHYEWIDVTKLRTVAHPSYVDKALKLSGSVAAFGSS